MLQARAQGQGVCRWKKQGYQLSTVEARLDALSVQKGGLTARLTRLAPKFSRSMSLIATILFSGLHLANHTCMGAQTMHVTHGRCIAMCCSHSSRLVCGKLSSAHCSIISVFCQEKKRDYLFMQVPSACKTGAVAEQLRPGVGKEDLAMSRLCELHRRKRNKLTVALAPFPTTSTSS